jgi:hypothetical protein
MPANTRQFSMALDALAELKTETATPLPYPTPAAPTLDSVLADIGPLPREALFLGIASDGLPVLLNLHDSTPGPMLIIGGAGSGKTRFLQTAAQSISKTHSSKDVQFGVITNLPDEWNEVANTPHKAGVFSVHQSGAQDFLLSLASWAHSNKNDRQSVLLLIDDLEAVARLGFDALQNLRWLLLRGPARRVWPLITMNADRYGQVISWIPIFRTRIFGRIENARVAAALGADDASEVASLEAAIQFSLRERREWLRFWLPSC